VRFLCLAASIFHSRGGLEGVLDTIFVFWS